MSKFIDRTGEKKLAANGCEMEIIEYFNSRNITVRFADGYITKNREYKEFASGKIKNPNIKTDYSKEKAEKLAKERIGMEFTAKNGLKLKIADYKDSGNVTIQFEDGVIVKNLLWGNILKGNIKHPEINARLHSGRIGEINTNLLGQKMEIIEYVDKDNIIVRFEDGAIRKTRYKSFLDGQVQHPDIAVNGPNASKSILAKKKHIGEKKLANNGQMMEIIEYKSCKNVKGNVLVRFEDGTIVETTAQQFKHNEVKNPNFTTKQYKMSLNVGVKHRMKNGFGLTVTAYRGENDVDIVWDDGLIATGLLFKSIKFETLKHPGLKSGGTFNGFTVIKEAFRENADTYYICRKNGRDNILTPYQMLEE